MYIETTEKLLDFIEKSPTAFQAVDEMQKRVTENGFEVLSEKKILETGSGRKISGDQKSFCTDRILHTEGRYKSISHYGKPQRFSFIQDQRESGDQSK